MFKKRNYILGLVFIAFIFSCNRTGDSDAEIKNQFKEMELFTVIYGKPLQSFQIDSTGKIIQYVKYSNKTRIYSFSLESEELDSLQSFLHLLPNFEEPPYDETKGCVDGVSYDLTINTKDKKYDLANTICEDITIVDEMVLFLLNTTENKNKNILFKNLVEYQTLMIEADSVLNL